MTAKATNNKAELQAAVLGLEEAKEHNFKKVELNTDSKLLKHVMTKWIDEWKERNWKKLDGSTLKNLLNRHEKRPKLSTNQICL